MPVVLFADLEVWSGVLGVCVGAIPVLGAWIISVIKAKGDEKRMERSDIIKEYQQYVDRIQIQVDHMAADAKAQDTRIDTLLREVSACEKRAAEQTVRLQLTEAELIRVREEMGRLTGRTNAVEKRQDKVDSVIMPAPGQPKPPLPSESGKGGP